MNNRLVLIIAVLCMAIIVYLFIMKQQGQMQAVAPTASPTNGLVQTDMGAKPIPQPEVATPSAAPAPAAEAVPTPTPAQQAGEAIKDAAEAVNDKAAEVTGIEAAPPASPEPGPATPAVQQGEQPPEVPSAQPAAGNP